MDKRGADEHLVRSWHAWAFRLALFLTGDRERAADLAQDALVKALVRRPPDLAEEAFGSWLRTVMVRLQIDHGRRLVREIAALKRWAPLHGEPHADPEPEDRSPLLAALATLSPRQRACIVLRYLDDLSEEQVAGELGLRLGTVKAHLARGREALRGTLSGTRGFAPASDARNPLGPPETSP
jgi:RNA polymerase sigma-70 factor (ECF subfamily)